MATEFRMPQLGESVTEGTILRWLKQPGDHIAVDDPLAEVETEKVNAEVASPYEGILAQLLVAEGETVAVGTPIALIDEAGVPLERPESAAETAARAGSELQRSEAPPVSPARPERAAVRGRNGARRAASPSFAAVGPLGPASTAHGMFSTAEPGAEPAAEVPANAAPADASERPSDDSAPNGDGREMSNRYSPAVLRLSHAHDVDLKLLRGTGAGGRITRKDVQLFIDSGGRVAAPRQAATPGNLDEERQLATPPTTASVEPVSAPEVRELQEAFAEPMSGAPPVVAAPRPESAAAAKPTPAPPQAIPAIAPSALGPDEELEPLSPTRRAIAAHMSQSVRTSPHAWMMVEVDVTLLVQFRERIKEEFRRREGVELTYLAFMVKAVVAALKQHPRLNSSWSDDGVVIKRRLNLGIAVDSPQGLVVPVIHDADNYSVAGVARVLHDLVERARSRRLRLDDVQGGTCTIDNVGPIGSVVSQPIINQPQAAIVTMESIVKRPVIVDDTIAVRSIMNCCLSFDHRVLDGGDVGPFMKTLKRTLEAMGSETPLY